MAVLRSENPEGKKIKTYVKIAGMADNLVYWGQSKKKKKNCPQVKWQNCYYYQRLKRQVKILNLASTLIVQTYIYKLSLVSWGQR